MTFVSHSRSYANIILGAGLLGLSLLLTGCDFEPHDSLSQPSPSMPVPANARGANKATDDKGGQSTMPVPTEQEMGMPIYPNSTVYVDLTGRPIAPNLLGSTTTAMLTSIDGVDKVIDFYKRSLFKVDSDGTKNPASVREETKEGTRRVIIIGNDAAGNVMMAIVHDDNGRAIMELMRTETRSVPASVSGSATGTKTTDDPAGSTPTTPTGSTGTTAGSTTSSLPAPTPISGMQTGEQPGKSGSNQKSSGATKSGGVVQPYSPGTGN